MASKWKVLSLKERADLINFVGSGKGCCELDKGFKTENLKPVTFQNAKQNLFEHLRSFAWV